MAKLGLVINNKELMKRWNYDKNNTFGFFPDKLTCGSNKKVWWKCEECGYEWNAICNNCNKGEGCPLCANKVLVSGKNDLATLYPDIAKKWDVKRNSLKASEVFAHSNKMGCWVCDKNEKHIFKAKICHMTEGRIICPVCSNQVIIIGVNDLATTHPELVNEWDYEKNKITPQEVTYGSVKKVWWKCNYGHRWIATILSRAGAQKTGCPICKKEMHISFPEKAIAFYLSKLFKIDENKHFSWLGNREFDIYIDELKLAIEFDGAKWHQNIARDKKKDELCYKNNIFLIRVRDLGCPNYISTSYKIQCQADKTQGIQEPIYKIIDCINNKYNMHLSLDINIDEDYNTILSNVLNIKKNNSVANSPLINEWNYKRNGNLNPATIGLGSHRKVWWICSEGHEWQAVVYSRNGNSKCGCPICAHKKRMNKNY